jgi:Ca-activated chloride channel homolog
MSRDPISGNIETFLSIGLISKFDGQGLEIYNRRRPLDLVVLLDVSGSMSACIDSSYERDGTCQQGMPTSANTSKLALAIESLKEVLSRLKDTDAFGLAVFSAEAEVLIPLTPLPGLNRTLANEILNSIASRGSTNLAAGLECAYAMLHAPERAGAGRVFVFTDDNTNTGDTSAGELVRLVKNAAEERVYTSIIGERSLRSAVSTFQTMIALASFWSLVE